MIRLEVYLTIQINFVHREKRCNRCDVHHLLTWIAAASPLVVFQIQFKTTKQTNKWIQQIQDKNKRKRLKTDCVNVCLHVSMCMTLHAFEDRQRVWVYVQSM